MHQADFADSICIPPAIGGNLDKFAGGGWISVRQLNALVEGAIDLLDRHSGDIDLEDDDPDHDRLDDRLCGGEISWPEWHTLDAATQADSGGVILIGQSEDDEDEGHSEPSTWTEAQGARSLTQSEDIEEDDPPEDDGEDCCRAGDDDTAGMFIADTDDGLPGTTEDGEEEWQA